MDNEADLSAKKQLDIGVNDHEEVRKLIESAKTDRDAIGQLYRIHHGVVATYVNRRVSNAEDADDIISEVFIAMVKGLPSFKWRGVPFNIWLYRIATNKISRWARQRRSIVVDQLQDLQAKSTEPSEHVDTEFIALALECLPIKLQDVLTLHYFEGLGIAEIASVLNRSEGTVKSRLHTGRAKMRSQLEKRGIQIEKLGSNDESL